MKIDKTTHYKGFSKIYFKKIISSIIKIGNLDTKEKIILDFGCGEKYLSKTLPQKKILNYDVDPKYSDYEDYKNLYFDIVVFNHVLMYMDKKEIISTFFNIQKINKNCRFLIGIGKEKFLNKMAAFVTLNLQAHKGTRSSYTEQMNIINEKMNILDTKKNIFFMSDIYYLKFKNE